MVRYRSPRLARGVSLIEVLVAVVVFSVGILGLALMQMKGAQFTKDAGSRTNAILLTRSLADAMRANAQAARQPVPVPPSTTAGPCPYCTTTYASGDLKVATACTAGDKDAAGTAKCDLARWMESLKAAAPGPTTGDIGSVTWDSTLGVYVIRTSWSGMKLKDSDSGDLGYGFTYLP